MAYNRHDTETNRQQNDLGATTYLLVGIFATIIAFAGLIVSVGPTSIQ